VLALRGQRDQLVNTMGLVRDIGTDLFRSEKLAKDINRRRLVNIVVLYLIVFLLSATNGLVLYFKFH